MILIVQNVMITIYKLDDEKVKRFVKCEIEYVKANPTQNMTILVLSEVLKNKKKIASQLMAYQSVHAEQVGYIRPPRISTNDAQLEMSGGEFCGNACMALAVYLINEKLNKNDPIMLEVSGTDRIVECNVSRDKVSSWCEVSMPLPDRIYSYQMKYLEKEWTGVIVEYSDAVHFILEIKEWSQSEIESLTMHLHSYFPKSVVGILLYQSDHRMHPLIYVPEVNSMVWEQGCGSGTASIGAYLSKKYERNISLGIRQPGGIIEVNAKYEETTIASISIKGRVEIVAKGTAVITA